MGSAFSPEYEAYVPYILFYLAVSHSLYQDDVTSMSYHGSHPFPRQSFPFDLLIDSKSDPSVSKVVQQLGFVAL